MIYVTLAQSLLIVLLIFDRGSERRENAKERAELLQRIQAPEAAVVAHDVKGRDVPAVGVDDDDAYWASKEDLARALEDL